MSLRTGKVGWGILGCARITRRGLIPGIRQSSLGSLVALASRDADKVTAWGKEFDVPRCYAGYDELLADPEIDVVYIPLPNELHLPWTVRAAQSGKHVLCDKPLARNAAEAREMVAACQQAGVRLMEGFMWRHHPRSRRLVELVRTGAIGTVRLVRASFSFDIDRSDWRMEPDRGGGALWDVGCYGVNAARLIAGAEPITVAAAARRHETRVDMTLAATLKFPDGILAQVDCSFELPYRCEVEIVGTSGRIVMPQAFLPDQRPHLLVEQAGRGERIEFAPANQYSEMVDSFSRSIETGKPLEPPAEDGLANMVLLDRVLSLAAPTMM